MLIEAIAVIAAVLFTGAAIYINVAEQPARLALPDAAMLAQWQASYRRAAPMQAGLALAGGSAVSVFPCPCPISVSTRRATTARRRRRVHVDVVSAVATGR